MLSLLRGHGAEVWHTLAARATVGWARVRPLDWPLRGRYMGGTLSAISLACSELWAGKCPHKTEGSPSILLEKCCKAWVEL